MNADWCVVDGVVCVQHLLRAAVPGARGGQPHRHHAGDQLHRSGHHRRVHVQRRNQRLSGSMFNSFTHFNYNFNIKKT